MKKLLIALLGVISINTFASAEIKKDIDEKKGEYSVYIDNKSSDKLNKSLFMNSDGSVIIIEKNLPKRTYFKCYDEFGLSADNELIKPRNLEFTSQGARLYIEDFSDNEELINEAKNAPKIYEESFLLELTNKSIQKILSSKSLSLKICDLNAEFSEEELQAFKDLINEKQGTKK